MNNFLTKSNETKMQANSKTTILKREFKFLFESLRGVLEVISKEKEKMEEIKEMEENTTKAFYNGQDSIITFSHITPNKNIKKKNSFYKYTPVNPFEIISYTKDEEHYNKIS